MVVSAVVLQMGVSLNSNIPALNAQRQLNRSSQSLRQSFERLSSGLRIVRASDDAAGLAISSSLRVDSRVFSQAQRNINDMLSMINIAEGGSEQLGTILLRLRELAAQSANGVLSVKQRSALQGESDALVSEFNRIVGTTSFNGLSLLDSSAETEIQVGYQSLILPSLQADVGLENTGTFKASITGVGSANPIFTAQVGDVNGDGILDLVNAMYFDSAVQVQIGNGDGTFSFGATFSGVDFIQHTKIADLNNDGHLDILSYSQSDYSIGISIGNGDGSFKATQFLDTDTNTSNGIAVADFNGDSIVDIYKGSQFLIGNGNGTFKIGINFSSPSYAYLHQADVNDDGVQDIFFRDAASARLRVVLANGNGTFTVARTVSVLGLATNGMATGDFNGDGLLDIAGSSLNQIVLYYGNGNGSFRAPQSFSTSYQANSLSSGDLNGDGRVDLAAAFTSAGGPSIFLNNGDGTFAAGNTSSADERWIFIGDINGDGANDVLKSEYYGGNSLQVLIGNGAPSPTLRSIDLSSRTGAKGALRYLSMAAERLSLSRATSGASASRLDFALATLGSTIENYESAARQISDVDVAEEAANLTRNRILQDAGSAILTQANIQPQIALSLLANLRS